MSDRPNQLMRLGQAIQVPQPQNALAPRPTAADAYDAAAQWLAQQRAISSQRGLWDDAAGRPTAAGLVDVTQQYGNALLMGSLAPGYLASRNPRMLNLPTQATPGATRGLAEAETVNAPYYDPEGRPLGASTIVGRGREPSAGEVSLAPAEINPLAEAITGAAPMASSGRELRGDAGRYNVRTGQIDYVQGLTDVQRGQVVSHEIGHALDELSGTISTKGLTAELKTIYNEQNNPQSHGSPFLPRQAGYKNPVEQQRELMAEAIRGYMTSPDTFKAIAPQTAAAIRKAINEHPTLSKVIQFNSVGGLLAAGAASDTSP